MHRRAITHYQELRCRSLIEVPIALLKIAEKHYNILNGLWKLWVRPIILCGNLRARQCGREGQNGLFGWDSDHVALVPYNIKEGDILRAVAAITNPPSSTLPDSPFIRALGIPAAHKAPPQTGTLAQRALEEWERTLCENKAVAILAQMQAGRPALIQKDGGEMLIAIVLDRPLAEAKALVDDPAAFTREMTRSLIAKQSHPLIAQMIKPAGSGDPQ